MLIRFVIVLAITLDVWCARPSYKDLAQECFTFHEMLDRARNWAARPATSNSHDEILKPGWYRVLGEAGNSLKEGYEQSVDVNDKLPNFCGTELSGTLMGSHPTEEEGILPMTVCFRPQQCMIKGPKGSCRCKGEKLIYARNCRTYFVYWLTPTTGQQRYCTSSTFLDGPKVTAGISDALECKQYHTLDNKDRYWDQPGDEKCDTDKHGWYRFNGNFDNKGKAFTEMASTCDTKKFLHRYSQPCGTTYRGHIVDKHPAVYEGRVERRVCFSYSSNCACEFYSNVGIRNCGKFYVYRLAGIPSCAARYCAGRSNQTAIDTDKKKPGPAPAKENMCNKYKVLHDPDRLWSFSNPTVSKCDSQLYGKYRFGSLFTPWRVKEGCADRDLAVMTHRCGSNLLGFMVDKHPAKKDGVVDRIICFTNGEKLCQCQNTTVIKVQNCGDYFVYNFKSVPSCASRFCMIANNSEALQIDPSKTPEYEIPPPNSSIPIPPARKEISEDHHNLIVSTTVLSLLVFIFIIIIIIIVVFFLFVLRKKQKQRRRYSDGDDVPKHKTEQRTLEVPSEMQRAAPVNERPLPSLNNDSPQHSEESLDRYETTDMAPLMPNGTSPSAPVEEHDNDVDDDDGLEREMDDLQRAIDEMGVPEDGSDDYNTLLRDEHKPTSYEEANKVDTVV